jgi:hypothetical protein
MHYPKEINSSSYLKYSPDYNQRFKSYIISTFLFTLIISSLLIFLNSELNTFQLISCCLLSMLSLTTCGMLMEQKTGIGWFEFLRIFYWILVPFSFYNSDLFTNLFIFNTSLALLSFFWFYRLKGIKYV